MEEKVLQIVIVEDLEVGEYIEYLQSIRLIVLIGLGVFCTTQVTK